LPERWICFGRPALHASRVTFAGAEGVAAFDVSAPAPKEMDALVHD